MDSQSTYLLIVFVLLCIAVAWKLSRMIRQAEFQIAFHELDELHYQEWNRDPADELLAWYRVRNRILTKRRISQYKRQVYLSAIEVRINQCRAQKTQTHTVSRCGNKLTLITTQN